LIQHHHLYLGIPQIAGIWMGRDCPGNEVRLYFVLDVGLIIKVIQYFQDGFIGLVESLMSFIMLYAMLAKAKKALKKH